MRILPGDNDLATLRPDLAAEWHLEKNGALDIRAVSPGSKKRAWWKCGEGHEWQARISDRAYGGTSCPYCAGRKLLVGYNDLATVEPEIAAQWDDTLNGELTPEMVTRGSNKRAWWRCQYGHVWNALIYSRTGHKKRGCPVCAGNIKKRHNRFYEEEQNRNATHAEYLARKKRNDV